MLKTVLIVDDMEINQLILGRILSDEYRIITAFNGEEALKILRRTTCGTEEDIVDAVLLDINMPVMDGYELLTQVRSDPELSSIPIIMVTGNDDSEARIKSLSLGANDFIMKPYSSDIIRHCLQNNIALRDASEKVNALMRDRLTGLFTREAFFERVKEMISTHEPGYYVLTCFDIAHFKTINDQYGSEKGDEVLRHVALTFSKGFEPYGGLCCRLYADNFAVIYPISFQGSDELAAIRERAIHIQGLAAPIAFSIGRYHIVDPDVPPALMYDMASLAAENIKGRYDTKISIYNESMRKRLLREQEIVSEMDGALQDRQFEVWFQPQYNHSTGGMIGAEALVRWRHPQKGLIPPNEFIPLFEQNGFVYSLDKFVWEETCRLLRRWTDMGITPLPVSVNVSRYDILRSDVVDSIKELLIKYSLPIELLRLEVTESAFSEDQEQIVKVVHELVESGFTVEIDDFGSGYSSLNTLKDVPAQIVKLDMKFLKSSGDGSSSDRGGNIIESVIRMAKWLGMSVIAEGIETIKQADYLRSIGCNYMQGYLFARPMPAEQYESCLLGDTVHEGLFSLETVENLDNNTFWDPESIDTLIFNSYVGSACIFEFNNDKIELLRATEKFAHIIGNSEMTVADLILLDLYSYNDAESHELLISNLEESFITKQEVTGEYLFVGIPGCPHKTWLRSTVRVIASVGTRLLVYCTNENITLQRESEEKIVLLSEQLQNIMDNVDLGILAATLENGNVEYLMTNAQYYNMLGYTKAEFEASENFTTMTIAPEDVDRVLKSVAEINRAGDSLSLVYNVLKKDGSRRIFRASISVSNLSGVNKPVQLSVIRDITEETESEIREKRVSEQIRLIMRDVDCGITSATFDDDGKINILFANEKFYDIHGYTREQYETEVPDKFTLIHPEDREKAYFDTLNAYSSEKPEQLEYRLIRRDGSVCWVRVGLTSTHFTGIERNVHLCIFTDITEAKETERDLIERDDKLRFLNSMSHRLLTNPDADEGINAALTGLMEYFLAARAYIYEFDFDSQKATHSYEVCREGVSRGNIEQREISLTLIDTWLTALREKGYYAIDDVSSLSDDFLEEKEWLESQSIKSLFVVALWRGESLIGMMGIDDPGISLAKTDRFIAIGDYISVMLIRRGLNLRILNDNKLLLDIMSDMPGGFARLRRLDSGKLVPVYVNDGLCKLTGLSRGDMNRYYAEGAIGRTHPDDVPIVKSFRSNLTRDGESKSEIYRFLTYDGSYIPLIVFGRLTKNATNDTFFNLYYTDATEQLHEEEQQKALLDNLPGGAGLYKYADGQISVIYLNRSYRELVGNSVLEYSGVLRFSSVHPDDFELISRELITAISQNRSFKCNIRLHHANGSYIPVSAVGHIVPSDGGDYLIYVVFTPIIEGVASYQQVLPILLSAVMDSTSDLSFSKDSSFRYLSASRSLAKLVGVSDPKELIGKTDFDIFDAALAQKYRDDDEAVFESGNSIVDKIEIIPSEDGTPHYSSTSKYLLIDGMNNKIGIYATGHDITQTVVNEAQLQLVNDSIPGGIATYVCSSGDFNAENIRLTYFNDGFCRLFGFTREEYQSHFISNFASSILEEDKHILIDAWLSLMKEDTPVNCVYRANIKDGGVKWINQKAVATDRANGKVVINTILQDVTEQYELIDRLRISEEENNIATELAGNIVARYIIADRTLSLPPEVSKSASVPEVIEDVPYGQVRLGMISRESAEAYTGFFESIINGAKIASATFLQKYSGEWRWFEAKSSTVFSGSGEPVKAVISFTDVTEKLKRETIYKRWQQSLDMRDIGSYTLFRCNLNRNKTYDTRDGELISFDFNNAGNDFNSKVHAYAFAKIHSDNRDEYISFMNSDKMLASYYRGNRSASIDYRELYSDSPDGYRYIKLTIDLVENPNSTDIEAYLMYEDIDHAKRIELQTKQLAETDSLTGLLNRATFSEKAESLLSSSAPGIRHALLMIDIDGFKRVNDVFGHAEGDHALAEIASAIRSMTRRGDLSARFGGDEYMILLENITDENAVATKVKQLISMLRKAFSLEVQITGSIGISLFPRDGIVFSELYKKADSALYFVKGSGKDNFAFYRDDMADEHLKPEPDIVNVPGMPLLEKKRRMLIIDDNAVDFALLQEIFKKDFIIDKARDKNNALIRLRHYGSAISVVLLDLMIPGSDGFEVLEKMQELPELRAIPVILLSSDENRESCYKAIREGASDFVTKPVDTELLKIRVASAISKAENERLRAQNNLLEYQGAEIMRYEAALESAGVTFVDYSWLTGEFTYAPTISKYIAGHYDKRKFWQILLSDMVADTKTVQEMQQLVHSIAENHAQTTASRLVMLRTPSKKLHRFRMSIRKVMNEYNLTNRIVIALTDLDCDE